MKTKIKITFAVTVEYDVNPENYPGCTTDEERLSVDLKNANDDPFMMMMTDAAVWKIDGEIVREDAA